MAAAKSLSLAALLLVVVVVAVGLAPRGAEAATPLAVVAGVVPCSAGSSISVAAAQPFPNASVKLVCGSAVLAGATTDSSGTFSINLGAVTPSVLTPVLTNQCKVVVVTPLASCNASLAGITGTLAAPVKLVGADAGSGLGGLIGLIVGIVGGLLGDILSIVPTTFSMI